MPRLIFDIETIGDNFDEMDEATQHALTRWIEREAKDKASYEKDLARVKGEMGLSGLTGQIVALGLWMMPKTRARYIIRRQEKSMKILRKRGLSSASWMRPKC